MVAIGSIATGDTLVDGRSDYDIVLIFSSSLESDLDKLNHYLGTSKFTDHCFFIPFTKTDFLKSHSSSHDFSDRFRSRTLFGKDLIKEKQLPTAQETYQIYSAGLDREITSIKRRLLNASFWSEAKLRNIFSVCFKHVFMYLAIRIYYDTGYYPRTRKHVANNLNSKAVSLALDILDHINNRSTTEIILAAKSLVPLLQKLRN